MQDQEILLRRFGLPTAGDYWINGVHAERVVNLPPYTFQ